MHGMWRIDWFAGNWMIKVVGHAVETEEAEVREWRPVAEAIQASRGIKLQIRWTRVCVRSKAKIVTRKAQGDH
jgi:hypothetical protein